ncbi:LPS export ABC transporter periplasmic protein LptC [Oleiagrimonas sp. MCCC 1A03011]|uniref:LPS export ABC transporter periplasmic protein LptC n=1 Tax=Oleiagrimonas sp. MCCC 1A03011 TaxID=1926883 RepID=UPI001F0BA085|nr:LPS export ABC transporter periplasmic protein LptC [Oleiagrimonas sp. MCCC 1A03011]
MSTRRLIASMVALALAIGVVQLLVWWLQPTRNNRMDAGPPRSGYTLHDFTLYGYGDNGKLSYRLQAPRLERREGDDSLYLNQPKFLLPPKRAPGEPWTGHSDYGWVSAKGDELKLQGAVKMRRKAYAGTAAASIDTSDVTAWPKKNKVQTDEHVVMHQGTATMTGIGMRADLDTKHMELLNDFHGTFKPSTSKR